MTLFALGLSYKGELLLAFEFAIFSGRFKFFVSSLGRREAAEFRLAHLAAFQHAIFHAISCCDGFHHL